MAANYPTSAPAFAPIVDGVDYPQAADLNTVYEEVTAIGTALLTGGLEHHLFPESTGDNRDLGTSAKKWRDVHLSGAVNAASAALTTPLPVASGGTAAATATANTVFAGPSSGGAAAPAFRALTAADLGVVGGVSVVTKDVTATTIVSSAAETTVFTHSLTGGTLGTGSAIRLTVIADLLNNTGGDQTTTFRVKFAGTTIASLAKISGTGASRRTVVISTVISALNATNAQRAATTITVSADQAAGTISATLGADFIGTCRYDTLAADSTSAQTLAVTAQHGASDAALSLISQVAFLEWLP